MALFHRKPSLAASIVALAAIGILLFLGLWQVKRLIWKEGLIAQIEAANAAEPLQGLPQNVEDWDEYRFRKVVFKGTIYPSTQFHITPRHHNGKLGFHIFSPVFIEPVRADKEEYIENTVVLVNRGWVPTDDKESVHGPSPFIPYENRTFEFTGMIRTQNDRNPFTPANQPDRNIWFGRDIAAMATHSGYEKSLLAKSLPITIDLLESTVPDRATNVPPIPVKGEIKLMNNHCGYAVTWFGLAIVAAVIFILYHRDR